MKDMGFQLSRVHKACKPRVTATTAKHQYIESEGERENSDF